MSPKASMFCLMTGFLQQEIGMATLLGLSVAVVLGVGIYRGKPTKTVIKPDAVITMRIDPMARSGRLSPRKSAGSGKVRLLKAV